MDSPQSDSAENSTENSASRASGFQPGNPFRFKPGECPNPGGRPKKSLLTEMTAELLEEIATDPEKRAAFKQSLLQKLHAKGVVSAMTLDKLWERHEGKVVQPVQVDGELNLTLSERFTKAKQLKDEVSGDK